MKTDAPSPTTVTGPAIPLRHFFASSKDNALRKLMRKKVQLLHKVDEAQQAVAEAEAEIADYVAAKYPADEPTEPQAAALEPVA